MKPSYAITNRGHSVKKSSRGLRDCLNQVARNRVGRTSRVPEVPLTRTPLRPRYYRKILPNVLGYLKVGIFCHGMIRDITHRC